MTCQGAYMGVHTFYKCTCRPDREFHQCKNGKRAPPKKRGLFATSTPSWLADNQYLLDRPIRLQIENRVCSHARFSIAEQSENDAALYDVHILVHV